MMSTRINGDCHTIGIKSQNLIYIYNINIHYHMLITQ